MDGTEQTAVAHFSEPNMERELNGSWKVSGIIREVHLSPHRDQGLDRINKVTSTQDLLLGTS